MIFKRHLILILSFLSFALAHSQVQEGKASYYSKRATGAKTSSGERLHHDSLTCAHRTYPFGTMLKVTNPSNNKSVVVRVTDRGPFIKGRIIDLSWRAAKGLGMLTQGVAMVVVEVVDDDIVPFRPKNDNVLPELDFGSTDYKYAIPELWKEKLNKQNGENGSKKTTSKDGNEKPNAEPKGTAIAAKNTRKAQ